MDGAEEGELVRFEVVQEISLDARLDRRRQQGIAQPFLGQPNLHKVLVGIPRFIPVVRAFPSAKFLKRKSNFLKSGRRYVGMSDNLAAQIGRSSCRLRA